MKQKKFMYDDNTPKMSNAIYRKLKYTGNVQYSKRGYSNVIYLRAETLVIGEAVAITIQKQLSNVIVESDSQIVI